MKRLWRAVRGQGGYSITELLLVMVILGTILGGLTTAFVSGSRAEVRSNRRVQAQLQATAAFDRLRRDVHCASSTNATPGTPVSSITLSGCATGSVYWCALTSPSNSSLYALYRTTASPCSSSGKLYGDYLLSSTVFTYTAPIAATSLAKVHADVRVSVHPTQALDTFELQDDIVLRNSTRT